MTKVFIGGSRRTSRLSAAVRQRLDRIIERRFPVLIGDANGADKAVQNYLCARGYDRVEVFCMDGLCRNNVGDWTTRAVSAPPGAKDFQYYSTKDEEMARESTIGFMLWDGRSKGTLANISRLLDRGKRVVVYTAPTREFETLANSNDWESFACKWTKNSHRPQRGHMRTPERQPSTSRQAGLF